MTFSVSSVEMYAPWSRIGSLLPGGRNSMSPLPSSASAPFWSRMVRLSTFDATRNAIRLGKFALMRPVITFTDGRCVARIRWMPMARAFCASMRERRLHLPLHRHHQVRQLVDHDDDEREHALRVRLVLGRLGGGVSGASALIVGQRDACGRAGCRSGFPSSTLRLKSARLRAPLAWSSS